MADLTPAVAPPSPSVPSPAPSEPPRKPLVPAGVAVVLAALSPMLLMAGSVLPAPWGGVVSILAFVMAGLAGIALPSPAWADGRPIVQGPALLVAGTAGPLVAGLSEHLPDGPIRLVAATVALVATFLAGKAAPQLGHVA